MKEILLMFGLVVVQNASFTLVSRARNSSSLLYHTLASIASNGIWLLVIRQVVVNLDSLSLMLTYLIASVIGSISMHYVAMKFFEKPKKVNCVKPLTDEEIIKFRQKIENPNKDRLEEFRKAWKEPSGEE